MVVNRPDWCISRQRAWGVPIPALDCADCGEAVLTPEIVERAASVFDEYGADAWYERPLPEFVPEGLTCPVRRHRVRARDEHPRRLVRLGLEPRSGASVPARPDLAGGYLSRRQRSASRVVPELAARRSRDARRTSVPGGPHPRLLRGRGRPEDVEVARQHHRAAGDHREERGRDHPPMGRDGGLPRGDPRRQGDPGTSRRGVPEAAQYAAHPGRQPVRLRSVERPGAPRPSNPSIGTSCRGTPS